MNETLIAAFFVVDDVNPKQLLLNLSDACRSSLVEQLSNYTPKYYDKKAFQIESGLNRRIVNDLFNSPTFPVTTINGNSKPVIELLDIISYFSTQRNWYTIKNCYPEKTHFTNYSLMGKMKNPRSLWTPNELYQLFQALNLSFRFLTAPNVSNLLHIPLQNSIDILKRSDAPTLKIGGSIYIEKNALLNFLKEVYI